jgi:hypothetical protein
MKNKLALDFRDNKDLQVALGGLEPGDGYELTIRGTVLSTDEERFEGDIEEIVQEGEDVEVDADKPVMAEVLAQREKKKASKAAASADEEEEEEDEL